MKKALSLAVFAALVISGCYRDKVDELFPGNGLFTPCDTTHNVSFEHHIKPLMENYCNSCHAGSSPSSGYSMVTYPEIQQWAVSGDLVGNVWHEAGYNAMPPSFQLDSCQMKQFKYWVDAGAPNN